MTNFIMLLTVAATMSASVLAQSNETGPTKEDPAKDTRMESTWEGYLVDAKSAMEITQKPETATQKATMYLKATALKEAANGFGIIADGRWIQFDEPSSQKALDFIKSSSHEQGIRVLVQGSLSGEMLAVSSIKEAPAPPEPPLN